jgi:hypothetical protein
MKFLAIRELIRIGQTKEELTSQDHILTKQRFSKRAKMNG